MQENKADELEQATMAIVVCRKDDVKIVIDGIEVLKEVPTTATAVAMFFGLSYTLNPKYPKSLQHTLEFVQKVLMQLGGKKMSPKVHRLSTQLYHPELNSTDWPVFVFPLLRTIYNVSTTKSLYTLYEVGVRYYGNTAVLTKVSAQVITGTSGQCAENWRASAFALQGTDLH